MKKFKYVLLQVKKGLTREFGFMDSDFIIEHYGKIDMGNYSKVYEGEIEAKNHMDARNQLWDIFNIHHPEDFEGRSMSVSDIVTIEDKSYYCESLGWSEVKL